MAGMVAGCITVTGLASRLIGAIVAWTVIGSAILLPCLSGCSHKSEIVEEISDEGMLLNDDLVAYRTGDGKVSIKNAATGIVTIKDIKIDWTQRSRNDSLAVFCSEGKRGYYNMYTGEIAVPAQYRRAWIFSEGLAAVQRNGNIGFIDHQGKVVIDFNYPYHGNPLTEFVFDDGHCVVANAEGKCGVIDKTGKWLIQPEYDNVNVFQEYAIVTKSGVSMQVTYDGRVLNSFVLDSVYELTYSEDERFENREGEVDMWTRPSIPACTPTASAAVTVSWTAIATASPNPCTVRSAPSTATCSAPASWTAGPRLS